MSAKHAAASRQHGMTTVEIALVLPVLILILCGIIETANMMRIQITLNSAASVLSRVVAVDPTVRTEAAATAYMLHNNLVTGVQQTLSNNVTANAPIVYLNPENPTCTSASCNPFNMSINYTYLAITPLMHQFFDGTVLSAATTKTTEPSSAGANTN